MILISGSMLFTSCKKGENDPGLSLRSRTNRLVGKWTISKGNVKETTGIITETTTIDGTSFTYNPGNGSNTTSGTFVGTVEFEKSGGFTDIRTFTVNGVANTTTIKGNWSWVGKNKEQNLKNKEAVYLTNTSFISNAGGSTSISWINPTGGSIWIIDQLKSKEMIVKYETSQSTGGASSSTSVNWTLTQE
jgi:hypothetical protein